jgi:hypothetical protein
MRVIRLAGICLLVMASCSDSEEERDLGVDLGADLTMKEDGVSDTAAPDTFVKTVKITGEQADWKGNMLTGVSICLYENGKKSTKCVQTDANGKFVIEAPASTESGIFVEKAGYEKAFWPFVLTQDYDTGSGGIYDDATATAEYGKVGSAYPPVEKGHIAVTAPAGATFTVSPSGGIGPHYASSGGGLDPALTSMQQSGWGMVFDLAPGIYEVTCEMPGTTCTAPLGWPSKTHTARLPVINGYFSQVDCSCK